MRTPVAACLAAAILLASGAGAWALSQAGDGFPHAEHEGLFPVCTGCHGQVESPDRGVRFPGADDCARCHDGMELERVAWSGRAVRPDNLDFSHAAHAQEVRERGEEPPGCQTCHQEPGGRVRMAVAGARPDACLTCHAHQAAQHLAGEAECLTCHLPLVEAEALTRRTIGDFPYPPDHEDPDFLLEHGPEADAVARCSVCHARDSCERCHLNAAELEPVQRLAPDPRVASLVAGVVPEYPEPPSHADEDWWFAHASRAREAPGTCANCHTRPSCQSCHVEGTDPALGALPAPPEGDPRGVRIRSEASRVHGPGFATGHRVEASALEESCTSCHQPSFCKSCHESSVEPAFHLQDFVSQHGAEAYAADTECASCHNPELFCRSCHAEVGLASRGRLDAGFHNRQPFWLLEHGEAARKGLESCTTCHAQVDCAQCHSARGGWGVSPHGPDFPARQLRDQSPRTCLRCHFGDPLGGGGP